MPADTDVAIRRFLEFPRGNLVIFSTDMLTGQPTSVVLRSPAVNPNGSTQACDANNGPFCKVNSIQEIAGERLWQIHLVFETYIREDSLASGEEEPILVSNQWSVATDTNWQHLTTRIIEGMVHFRADRLINTLNPAEAFRSTFASFTVPLGFQRTQVQSRTLASGNQVAYRIVDSEEPMLRPESATRRVVRLEYTESSWQWAGSIGRGAAQALSQGFEAPPILSGPSAIGGWFRGRVMGLANSGVNQLPKRHKTVIVRAWGNREMPRSGLINLGMALAVSRMGTQAFILPSTSESIISYHSAQMMAQIQSTIRWSFSDTGGIGNLQNVFTLGTALFSNPSGGVGDARFENFIRQPEDSPQLFIGPQFNRAQTPFPHDSGTRGTWYDGSDPQILARLTKQTLESIGAQDPGVPP
ncbi:MAG: hypothetical protein QOJ42_7662 [Acidobacteriaceae bacterium]|nr:hypothetical protein [Acidobacteriaceae bacterium]